MWPSLIGLMSSSEDQVIQMACWICGTAIQNNPKAQAAVSFLH
jgi:hsp70-interacting protein